MAFGIFRKRFTACANLEFEFFRCEGELKLQTVFGSAISTIFAFEFFPAGSVERTSTHSLRKYYMAKFKMGLLCLIGCLALSVQIPAQIVTNEYPLTALETMELTPSQLVVKGTAPVGYVSI